MNNNKSKDIINYYAEYVDEDGHHHHTVNQYNRVTGFITYLTDHIFN